MWRGKGRFQVVRPTAEITLTDLHNMSATTISFETLKLEKIIAPAFKKAKIINSGSISRKVTIQGLPVTPGAQKAIEAAGGSVSSE